MSSDHSGAKTGLTYKDAGVDIDAGEALVERIGPAAKATRRRGADADLGGFGGLFDLKAAGFKDPILVAGTDGVGTKLKLAIDTRRYDGIGQDLVAMCVNDIVVQGAEPLFFLDYYATGKLEVESAAMVVEGIARACKESGCALIGGETAEMPGLYAKGDFDLAGFAVGAVERDAILPKTGAMKAGDVLIGVASSGVHSNGYSLVRKVVEKSGLALGADAPFAPGKTLGEALLTPTRLYVRAALAAMRTGGVKGLAHITGGGITDNLPRCLPRWAGWRSRSRRDRRAARVPLAGEGGRHRRARNAAHLQLRHRHGGGGGRKTCRTGDRRLPGSRRSRHTHRQAGAPVPVRPKWSIAEP